MNPVLRISAARSRVCLVLLGLAFLVGPARASIVSDHNPAITSSRLDGPLQDRMLDMTVDASGNTYVVGSFNSPEMDVQTFGNDPAHPGSVVQTGITALRSSGGYDIFVAKYDPNGNLLWARSTGGQGDDIADGVVVDAAGNVYITGSYSGPANIGGTTLDNSLRTVATGQGAVTGSNFVITSDLFIAMLSPGGNWLWAKRLDYTLRNDGTGNFAPAAHGYIDFGPDDTNDPPEAGFIREGGSGYNTQLGYGFTNYDDPNSSLTLPASFVADDGPPDIAGTTRNDFTRVAFYQPQNGYRVDLPAGTFRVTIRCGDRANTQGTNLYDIRLKTSEGYETTVIDYQPGPAATGTAAMFTQQTVTVTLAQPGYIWIREGNQTNGGVQGLFSWIDWMTIDQQQNTPPDVGITGSLTMRSGDNQHLGQAMTIDPDGNLYIKGYFPGGYPFSQSIVPTDDTSFSLSFVSALGGMNSFQISDGMGVYGAAGNSFVTRLKLTNVGSDKTDPTSWAWDWLTPFGTGYDVIRFGDNVIISGLTADPSGDILVTGAWRGQLVAGGAPVLGTNYSETEANTEGYLLRLRHTDGQRTMLAPILANATDDFREVLPQAVAADPSGGIYVLGDYNPIFVEQLPLGTWNFHSATGAPGLTGKPGASEDFFVAKSNSAGEWQWVTHPTGTGLRSARGLALDPANNVFVTGALVSAPAGHGVGFGTTTLTCLVPGATDPFLAKLVQNATGAPTWAKANRAESRSALTYTTGYASGIPAALTASTGVRYSGDAHVTGTSTTKDANPTVAAITGTPDQALFRYERTGQTFSYNIPLADGDYSVTLGYAETEATGAGQRVFDVTSGTQVLRQGFDIFALAGGFQAVTDNYTLSTTNGILNISFTSANSGGVGLAKINNITIAPLNDSRYHGLEVGVTPSGILRWLVSSGGDSDYGSDLGVVQNEDAGLDFGGKYGLGTRTGAAAADDATQLYGGLLYSVDLNLIDEPPANTTGYPAGAAIPAPAGVAMDGSGHPLQPDILIGGASADSSAYFYWDSFAGTLYAVSPVASATINWRVSTDPANARRLSVPVSTRWPVAGETFQETLTGGGVAGNEPAVDLSYGDGTHRFLGLLYTSAGATLNGTSLSAAAAGFSTLLYLDGANSLPGQAAARIVVVRHDLWRNVVSTATISTAIGTAVIDTVHHQDPARNGFVFNTLSRYDATAYDRTSRFGPILPVNQDDPTDPNTEMVIGWYQKNALSGTYFPGYVAQYDCVWPAAPERIVITSAEGSDVAIPVVSGATTTYLYPQEQLTGTKFQNASIYNQPDKTLPGYNPNEEHALILDSQTRSGPLSVYALRNDLNNVNGYATSLPYVLLRYQDGTDSLKVKLKVYHVELTGSYAALDSKSVSHTATFDFTTFAGTAGTQVQPPFPLSSIALGPRPETTGSGLPFFRDHNGTTWARCAGSLKVAYYYPLISGFWYDPYGTGKNSPLPAVPWLTFATGLPAANQPSATGAPININYNIAWPALVPTLNVGDTLTHAKNGLPEVRNWLSAAIVYDGNVPNFGAFDPTVAQNANPLKLSARFFDALSPREVPFPSMLNGTQLVNTGGLAPLQVSLVSGGMYAITNLPPHLRSRVLFDPNFVGPSGLLGGLIFQGFDANDPTGASPVLINVMTTRELKAMQAADDSLTAATQGSQWDLAAQALYQLTRNPNAIDMDGNGQPDNALLYGLAAPPGVSGAFSANKLVAATIKAGAALTAGLGQGTGYMTLIQNNDPLLGAAPVTMNVIKIINPPVTGYVEVIKPDNVFDESVTLRHSADFGGNPDGLTFNWYYHEPAADGSAPTTLPSPAALNGWSLLNSGDQLGANDVVLKGSGLHILSDGYVFVQYKGYTAGGRSATAYNPLGGDRSATTKPLPALVSGWVSRVLTGVNAFDQRFNSFADSATQTYVSMIEQAGHRYEGDVAFNASASNLNGLGLLELYTTVFKRALALSIDGTPEATTSGTNAALLLAASRISDLDMLVANDAYADEQDPTIGYNTPDGGQFGALDSSVFSFEDQVPSLIDEELALLRGRDSSGAGVGAAPVYNRLFWNFTGGTGQPAYVSNYNITDLNADGFVDANDAAILYPQGHGDAWGQYLSALSPYYALLRHPLYTWVPRVEAVNIGGVAVQVNYEDERKFAAAAAAKATVGVEIVDLTYRDAYTGDPSGQWQGYKDTDPTRAWGVDEWARRAGQGALFDWMTANAILPATSTATGLKKVDRTTVPELKQIASEFDQMQSKMDNADKGLNPLGLSGDAIPFDIDPSLVTAANGKTHFEQIFDRAQSAVNNALGVFNFANQATQRIRQDQLSAAQFMQQSTDGETDYKNRMIEIFGYPYAGDIGAGQTYPSGYDGPDLYKWMYVDVATYSNAALPQPSGDFTGFFSAMNFGATGSAAPSGNINTLVGFYFPSDVTDPTQLYVPDPSGNKQIQYPILTDNQAGAEQWAFAATTAMGVRRAPGDLQMAIGDMVQKQAALQQSVSDYNSYVGSVMDQVELLQAQYQVNAATLNLQDSTNNTVENINDVVAGLNSNVAYLNAGATSVKDIAGALASALPTVEGFANDAFGPVRGAINLVGAVGESTLLLVSASMQSAAASDEAAENNLQLDTSLTIQQIQANYATLQQVKVLEDLLQNEPGYRVAIFQKKLDLSASEGTFREKLAEGQRLIEDRIAFRQKIAGPIENLRYQDLTFRNFRNNALQKYRASFDLAARYVFLAAKAYDYETCLPSTSGGVGSSFLTSIIRQQSLGELNGGVPVNGVDGLSDPMARMSQNFAVLKGQLGFNNPQTETNRFSVRQEFMRILPTDNDAWRKALQKYRVDDLWQVPEFRKFCRPFAPESVGPQPGLVIPMETTVTFGQNFFGQPLAGGDSSYDTTNFATKVRSVGVWFTNYDGHGLAATPRVYVVPAGFDIMRTPTSDTLATRQFSIVDQQLPVPFNLGTSDLTNPSFIPQNDSLDGTLFSIRQYNRFEAYQDDGFNLGQLTADSRSIGRSVWNTRWLLIIPGGTFLNDPNAGLDTFINGSLVPGSTTQRDGNGVSDIKLYFQTYAYPGD